MRTLEEIKMDIWKIFDESDLLDIRYQMAQDDIKQRSDLLWNEWRRTNVDGSASVNDGWAEHYKKRGW